MADTSDDEPVPASPSPDVLHAFRDQLTPELIKAARRYARQRATLVREVRRRIDPLYHLELVQDALGDTWRGTVRWDPARRSLLDHVRDVIRQRTFNDRRRAGVYQHVSMHHSPVANDEVGMIGLTIEAEITQAHGSGAVPSPAIVATLLDQVVLELHRLAARDLDARAILGCWAKGITDGSEVMDLTGLSENDYRKARQRILYLARHLPPELRDAAEDTLRSAS